MATLSPSPEPGGPLEPGATAEAQAPTLLTTEPTGGLPTFGGGISGARSVRRMARAITANRKATAGALIQALFLLITVTVLVAILLSDLLTAALDPRTRGSS